jgi:hypothetical protein
MDTNMNANNASKNVLNPEVEIKQFFLTVYSMPVHCPVLAHSLPVR